MDRKQALPCAHPTLVFHTIEPIKMRTGLVFAVLGAGVSLVEARRPPFLDECSVENVLRYFTCKRHIPESCVSELEQQAEAFCTSYLSVTATTVTLDLNTATANPP